MYHSKLSISQLSFTWYLKRKVFWNFESYFSLQVSNSTKILYFTITFISCFIERIIHCVLSFLMLLSHFNFFFFVFTDLGTTCSIINNWFCWPTLLYACGTHPFSYYNVVVKCASYSCWSSPKSWSLFECPYHDIGSRVTRYT